MQRIERYGVIALVFLLVTILAVSLWGEGRQGLKSSERVAEARPKSGARAADAPVSRTAPVESRGARDRALPTSQAPIGPFDASALALEEPAVTSAADVFAQGEARRQRRALADSQAAPDAALSTSIEALPPTVYVPQSAASAQRTSPAVAVSTARTVIVAAGETLSQIAQRELGSSKRWPEIAAFNGGLDPTKLRRGMILKLPPRDGSTAAPVASAAPSNAIAPAAEPQAVPAVALRGGSYVVRQGDVLGSIAQRELGSSKRWKEIVALNPGLDPERLLVGARLTMPSPTAATAAKGPAKSPTKSTGTQVAKAAAPAAQGGWSSSAAGGKVR